MNNLSDFFWWELKLSFFHELEESLIWKLGDLGIKDFAIECKTDHSLRKTLRAWLPSYEWSPKARSEVELSLIALTKVFEHNKLTFQWKKTGQEDWSASWKKFWRPDPVGQKILILPSWLDFPKLYSNRIPIILNPGSAFGTGTHPTTRLCLEAIERNPPEGLQVADIGCGSGILGIAALRLGALEVQAVDVDSLAIRATVENRRLNNFDENQLNVSLGSINELNKELNCLKVDLLVCNILAKVIKKLAPEFTNITSPKSQLLLSGLLVEQVEDITSVLSILGWNLIGSYRSQNWALIHLCKKTFESND